MERPTTTAIGGRAEDFACGYLLKHGLKLVTRNFRCRSGEIDLIMTDDDCLVFVEVRFRMSNRITRAIHTVDIHKQRKIIRTASLYVARQRRFALTAMRFDVIGICGDETEPVEWIKDAFRPLDSTL